MDGDATTNAVSYSLVDGFGDPVVGGAFAIDAASVWSALPTPASSTTRARPATTSLFGRRPRDGSFADETFTIALSDANEGGVGSISDSDAGANAVDENSAAGTVVRGDGVASDPDGSDTVSYSLSNDAGGLFAIDAVSGVVTVAGSLDREAASSYDIEVTATSSDGSTSSQSYTIALNDVDEFDVTTPTDSDAGANVVSESAANGTVVGVTASALDGDATTNAVSYSLVDGFGDPVVGGAFAIDAASGVVSVADTSQLDYESQASHDIIVRATSADGSFADETFTIALSDANEGGVGSISDSDAGANAVDENSAAGTVVGVTAFASDPDGSDTVSYSLSNDAGGLFAIDAVSGVVTVAGSLDREAASSYDIEVTATSSDGSTSSQSYTIALNDVDEFDVTTPTDSDAGANVVSESAANGTVSG